MAKRDYYEVLGIPRDASAQQIKSSYRKLAMKYHPDRNPGDTVAEDRFKEAAEAYEVLADDSKRAIYDRAGFDGLRSGGYSPFTGDLGDIFSQFGDIFSEFFGGRGGFGATGAGRGPRPMAGSDLHAAVELSLEEAASESKKTVELERTRPCEDCDASGARDGKMATCPSCGGRGQIVQGRGAFMIATTCRACGGAGRLAIESCPTCDGQGLVSNLRKLDVRIPAGVYSGLRLRLAGEGNTGLHGGPPGDLYVLLDVKPHDLFVREGPDLHCELSVGFGMACLGGEANVPGLLGDLHHVEVPAGARPGEVIRIPSAGMPRVDGAGKGDMVVHLTVEVPKKLSKAQEKAVKDLDSVLHSAPRVTPFSPDPRETKRRRKKTGGIFERIRDALDGD